MTIFNTVETNLAKISELSDAQLAKAFAKYQMEAKKKPSDKLKKVLIQINNERKKRQKKSTASATQSSSDLSSLISKASKSETSRRAKQKKKAPMVSQRLKKSDAPMITTHKANIMLALALLFGLTGVILVADDMWFSFIPLFNYKFTIGIVLIVPALVCAKVSSYLSDDNR
jgi:hypothetical protein